jgi:hypothetical protein
VKVSEARMRVVAGIALVLLVVHGTGCKNEPQPLGKLPRNGLASWAADCPSEIEEQPAKGGQREFVGTVFGEVRTTFRHADHMFVCKAPGWQLYVDQRDRVVGLCIDDNVYAEPGNRGVAERAQRQISKRWGDELAATMTQGTCAARTARIGPFLRWLRYAPPVVRLPDGTETRAPITGTLVTCCWEVAE